MKYRLFASDIDNTLIGFGQKTASAGVRDALRRIQKAGIPLVLSTGRGPAAISKTLLGSLKPDYIACCGGAYVIDRAGKEVVAMPLTPEEMYALTDWCEDYEFPLLFSYRDGYYVYVRYQYFYDAYAFDPVSQGAIFDGEDRDRHLIDMPFAAAAIMSRAGYQGFLEKYGYLSMNLFPVNITGDTVILDITGAGIDKGTGLAALGRQLGIGTEEMAAAGDSDNDLRMLEAVGLGCCMENGSEAARKAADLLIPPVSEDGVAVLCRRLWPELWDGQN